MMEKEPLDSYVRQTMWTLWNSVALSKTENNGLRFASSHLSRIPVAKWPWAPPQGVTTDGTDTYQAVFFSIMDQK